MSSRLQHDELLGISQALIQVIPAGSMTIGINSRELIQQIIPIETLCLAICADEAPFVITFSS